MRHYGDLLKDYLAYLNDHPLGGNPPELYDPANYIMGLGGKRIRPILALLGYQLFEEDPAKAMPLAHAVEVFHNFTLVHDDMMDRAELRRGKPTVHTKWDGNTAVLSGDVMLVQAFRIINGLDTSAENVQKISDDFGRMAEEVCVGQQFDMNFETLKDVSETDYLEMIKLKTSVLLAFSLQSGGILAGAPAETTNFLYSFGLNLGLGFQIMDDYLDTFGDQASFGKKIGGDILENKKTLLWIEARKRANPDQLNKLTSWYSTNEISDEKISAVTSIYRDLEIDRYIRGKMDKYLSEAQKTLAQLAQSVDTQNLENLTADLQKRQS